METQIDTFPGPGPSIPTTALLGSLSSPSLRVNPVVLGGSSVIANLGDFEILPLKILLLVFDLFKQDQKFDEYETACLIRMSREIKTFSFLVRTPI